MPDGSLIIVGTSGAIDRFWPETGEVQNINTQESMQEAHEYRFCNGRSIWRCLDWC